ncbi:hypothetical protein GCM10023220_63410 [Streptomyces ziwulingensis]|uniref:Uncharacterized protein n=1 Tax=Streptomyces ziwulingensis TaxID=1045501 RepID=A0ABP9CYI0_9ACTN
MPGSAPTETYAATVPTPASSGSASARPASAASDIRTSPAVNLALTARISRRNVRLSGSSPRPS